MKVALIGYGAVAAIHAAVLPAEVRGWVCGPDAEKAQLLATEYGFLGAAPEPPPDADAVIVASPSALHFEQALQSSRRGLAVLVELPACESAEQARELGTAGGRMVCAHTSRYLRFYQSMPLASLGEIRQIQYYRHVVPKQRSWQDDALRHHAQHPLDLLLHWFPDFEALYCVRRKREDVAILGRLQTTGAPVTITVSYSAERAASEMTLIGSAATLRTDGFSYCNTETADAEGSYYEAIRLQDKEFLAGGGIPWTETVRLASVTDALLTCS